MGGCRCSYKTCTNTTKTRENLHFFHYPVKHKERCGKWIENADKPQFYDLDEDQLRNKVVCETHFQDYYFPNLQRKRLLQNAIPTLDGDCVPIIEPPPQGGEVQVLPASDDNTIFVLETNENNYQSEGVESYIYTTNGLVLPIKKGNDGSNGVVQTIYQNQELTWKKPETPIIPIVETPTQKYVFQQPQPEENNTPMIEDTEIILVPSPEPPQRIKEVTIEDKYARKIRQHSRDIAILKRLLKSKKAFKKPSNWSILNTLKKQVPASLSTIVTMQLNSNYKISDEDREFFTTIYSKSPEVYKILSQKYKWKIPRPDLLLKKNNGAN